MSWLCWLHLWQHTLRPVMTWLCCCTCGIMFQLAMTWLCCCTCGSAQSNLSWLGCSVAPIAAHVPTCHDGSVYSAPEAACFPTCLSFVLLHVLQWLSLSQYTYGFVIQVSKKVIRMSELISLLKFCLVNCFLFDIPHCFVLLIVCVCVCVCVFAECWCHHRKGWFQHQEAEDWRE